MKLKTPGNMRVIPNQQNNINTKPVFVNKKPEEDTNGNTQNQGQFQVNNTTTNVSNSSPELKATTSQTNDPSQNSPLEPHSLTYGEEEEEDEDNENQDGENQDQTTLTSLKQQTSNSSTTQQQQQPIQMISNYMSVVGLCFGCRF